MLTIILTWLLKISFKQALFSYVHFTAIQTKCYHSYKMFDKVALTLNMSDLQKCN